MNIRTLLSFGSGAVRMAGMILLFFAVQFGCIWMASRFGGDIFFIELPPSVSAFWLLVSSVLTVVLFSLFSWVRPVDFRRGRWSWKGYACAVVWMLSAILPVNFLTEAMQLDNTLEQQFLAWMRIFWGMLNIILAAPLAEEVVFRAGLLGTMLRSGCSGGRAMVFSALLFAVFHGNPAQIPVAFLLGLMLGYLYLHSRSLWPGWFAHAANNLIGVLTAWGTGDDVPVSLTDMLGGPWPTAAILTLSLLLFVAIFFCIRRFYIVSRE